MSVDNLDYDSIWCDETVRDILTRQHQDSISVQNSIADLRQNLMTNPCPAELRGLVWKILLGVYQTSWEDYAGLLKDGPTTLAGNIKNDTFRTFSTDTKFTGNVTEDMLIRMLNAFVRVNDENNSRATIVRNQLNFHRIESLTYVQGMNVLAGPFLLALSEVEAFYSFSTFIFKWCPLYVQPTMRGVHCGLRLLDICLRALDPTLYGYLRGKNMSANTYAFASVMTFSACTPPLSELLQLWDYMFARGRHMNILFIIAQLALIRTELLQSPSPINLLRVLPPLRAKAIINLTNSLCKNLSPELHDKLARHAYDEEISNELGIQTTTDSNYTEQDDTTTDLPAFMVDAIDNVMIQ
ncbi:putative mitotic exit network regulator [Mucor mucedo]|uniref:putative mitotic exit network regulator n=1 Tax=Mucor mucedo TaxID=29922 RepID=UPI00221F472F|nr:putative mitotic exit network regulator [Mucor mucedo]KAI7893508.1 putative mitotic exit network regulator [Mucor mucedo]